MKRGMLVAAALLLSSSLAPALDMKPNHHQGPKSPPLPTVLSFDHMYGVDGPFVGETNPIRGVIGDELPWTITGFIKGRLDTKGHLKILVKGLVFGDDPEVPPELRGKNDEETFRGLVSCLTEVSPTEVGTSNVLTRGFTSTPDGDSFIDDVIELPNPCIAPIVFVMSGSEEKWFAVTGIETED